MGYNNELYHFGVKGMRWGVRKDDYRSSGVRSALAKRSNKKVDKGFENWKKNAALKEDAINKGKTRNEKRMAYEKDKKNKSLKSDYKQANKDYKKALKKNTTYRKGSIREEVGRDMSRKYMSEAKKAKNLGDKKTYSKLMSKHDIERAKARRAQTVGANRSKRKAAYKRATTMAVKTAVASAAVAGGVYYVNNHTNMNVSVKNVSTLAKYAKLARSFIY